MALSCIKLKNFKAFGEEVSIPIGPITIIYGQNSAGKSSITQALLLLKQTLEGRDPSAALSPRTEEGFVNLGSFQELIFDHKLTNDLEITLEFSDLPFCKSPTFRGISNTFSITYVFTRRDLKSEIKLESIRLGSPDLDEPIAIWANPNFIDPSKSPLVRARFDQQQSFVGPSAVYGLTHLTRNKKFWGNSFNQLKNSEASILKRISEFQRNPKGWQPRSFYVRPISSPSPDSLMARFSKRVNDLSKYLSEKPNTIESWTGFLAAQFRHTFVGATGFLINSFDPQLLELDEILSADFDPIRIAIGTDRFGLLPEPGRLLVALSGAVQTFLTQLFPLGPFRRAPERYYIYTGSSPLDVGYKGDLMPDLLFRREDLLKQANKWMKQLELGYALKIKPVAKGQDLYELRLTDTLREKNFGVSLSDVGFGISQILPFIVQSLSASRQTINIEQPEVHIHPKLQADIGGLILHSYRTLSNNFIIETHSEHLMLRLQALVSKGKIKPFELSILYVRRGAKGSTVSRINLDGDGDFKEEWPGGFFPERLREIRGR